MYQRHDFTAATAIDLASIDPTFCEWTRSDVKVLTLSRLSVLFVLSTVAWVPVAAAYLALA